MKILILANYDLALYKFRRELLERLLTQGNDVVISLPEGEFVPKLQELGCRYIQTSLNRRGVNPFEDLALLNHYREIISAEKPDIVLTYTVKPNVYGGMACSMLKIPYIVNVTGVGDAVENGGILQAVVKRLYALGLKKAHTVFFQNKTNQELFEKWGIAHNKAKLIPGSGVNLTHHAPATYPAEGTTRFLFIGRITKDKGIDELLEAMHTVHQQYPNTYLDIIGMMDGGYQKVMDAVNQLDYIHYHGGQSDVRPFIHNSHCTVLPSYHEGIANVLLESAAATRPVIATQVAGCQETFDEGVSGLGCLSKDTQSLADAMIRFINMPYEQKKNMGIAGRNKVEQEFDRNVVVEAYINAIMDATKQKVLVNI